VFAKRAFLSALLLAAFAAGAAAQERRVFELEIVKRSVKVRQGDDVVLRWKTDEAVTLHLHGYNLTAGVTAGGTAAMSFKARATGRFTVETHSIGKDTKLARTLLYVEVHPR
jgi:hypothetical protein